MLPNQIPQCGDIGVNLVPGRQGLEFRYNKIGLKMNPNNMEQVFT